MAYSKRVGWLLLLGLASALASPATAAEGTKAEISLRAIRSPDLPDDGPRFFTFRQLMAKQNGETAPPRPQMPKPMIASVEPENIVTDLPMPRVETPFASRGFALFASMNDAIARKWRTVTDEWRKESRMLAACEQGGKCARGAGIMASIKREASETAGLEQLSLVNARVNATVRYMSDFMRHGIEDHWSTPLETLGKAGDCEDYAIAKFFILRELGMPEEDLRIILVRDRRAREDHAVLAVRAAFGWHLLDNRTSVIESDQSMPHYRPMIALNSTRMEMFAAPYAELDEPELRDSIVPAAEALNLEAATPVLRTALD